MNIGFYRMATDGACSGNPGPGGYAAVILPVVPGETHVRHQVTGHAPRSTNNAMEVMALIAGLRAIPTGAKVLVLTDSANLIGWLSRGWKRRDAGLRPLLAEADRLMAERTVEFEKVPGHAGQPLNEQAHALAEREAKAARDCACASHPINEIVTESPAVLGALNDDILVGCPDALPFPTLFATWKPAYTTLLHTLLVEHIADMAQIGASSPVAEELLTALDRGIREGSVAR